MSTAVRPGASSLDDSVVSFSPPRITLLYTCGLAAAASAMLLLPISYLLLIGALAYTLWWYATVALSSVSLSFMTVPLYASPLVAGGILVFFTLKPFLAE